MRKHLERLFETVDDPVVLMDQLQRHEGLRLHPYRCTANKLTIGVGRNLDDVGITSAEADILLVNDLIRVIEELRQTFSVFDRLDNVRKSVLIDMCFNLGISRLQLFKKMFAAIDDQNWTLAATEMVDSRWCSQVGQRCEALKTMMETGKRW